MTDKELQLFEQMISMLGDAGEGSFWLLLFWIGKGYFVSTLIIAMVLVLGILVYRAVYAGITTSNFIDEARRTAGVCSYGVVTKDERKRVLELIKKGKQQEESK